jgi:perosamine synthetase
LGKDRARFRRALDAEGVSFYEGYTRPLYLQPLYQRRLAFKRGYPFSAPPNRASRPDYRRGACPAAETLYFKQMLVNEHVRPPHALSDVRDIARAVEKVATALN